MRVEVAMPHMGQSMEEGTVLSWLKPAGAEVERGEAIAEIETDKAVVELQSFVTGTLVEIFVPEGETVPVGTAIAIIDDGQPAPETVPELEPASATPRERVSASPAASRLAQEHGVDLTQVKPCDPGRHIDRADVEAYLAQSRTGQVQVGPAAPPRSRVKASPVARRLAEERGVDLTRVRGTGPAGRISREDVEAWLSAQQQPAPVPVDVEEVTRVPLAKIKQTTARRMSESKATIPHFYASTDVEMGRALSLRDSLKARGFDVSINDLILRATTLVLATYPNLNATFAGDELCVYPHVNLAVAVAMDEGLITPVIHNCESLSLAELADAAHEVVDRARAGRLRPRDLEGGTFTVSNLGMFGVTHFQAIVNPPQAAILAVGTLRRVPVFDTYDRLVPARLLTATVSADHRVTDGAEVARFLQDLKRVLEDGFGLV